MHVDLIFVCHASTAAVRSASFPADEPLDEPGLAAAAAAAAAAAGSSAEPHRADRTWSAPSLAARQTAAALGLDAQVAPALRDCDFGRWAGRPLADVARDEPLAFGAWMADPASKPHGGEALTEVLDRVARWVDGCLRTPGVTVAVTHPTVIRAAVVHAIDAAPATFWHLDIAPLTRTTLRGDGHRWNLRGLQA